MRHPRHRLPPAHRTTYASRSPINRLHSAAVHTMPATAGLASADMAGSGRRHRNRQQIPLPGLVVTGGHQTRATKPARLHSRRLPTEPAWRCCNDAGRQRIHHPRTPTCRVRAAALSPMAASACSTASLRTCLSGVYPIKEIRYADGTQAGGSCLPAFLIAARSRHRPLTILRGTCGDPQALRKLVPI